MRRRAFFTILTILLFLMPWARPVLADAGAWTRVGPDTGLVAVLAAAPSSPSTVYAGLTVGGVFRSRDGGATWSFAGAGLRLDSAIHSLAVDARRPDSLWAATFQGIYRSVNGGASWDLQWSGGALVIVQEPRSGALYAGVEGGPILRSLDGGASWQTLSASPVNVSALAIDPTHPQTLYAGGSSGVAKSVDGGAKWRSLTRGLPDFSISRIVVDPLSPQRLYASTTNGERGLFESLFRSDDAGQHWAPADGGVISGFITSLAIQPGKRGAVWVVAGGDLFRSLDQGRTWTLAEEGLPPHRVLRVLPGASTLLAGALSGVFRSGDQGASWGRSSRGLQAAPISGLALDPLQPLRLWAAVTNGEVYRTATGGRRWGLLTGAPSSAIVNGPLVADPNRSGTAYLGLLGGIARTGDAGNHWATAPLACLVPHTIAVDPLDSSVIYTTGGFSDTGCEDGPNACAMFRSDDSGQSWTCVRNGLPEGEILAPDPFQASRVYTLVNRGLDDDVYVSPDRGSTWSLLAAGVDIRLLFPDPHRPGTLWGGESKSILLRSDDGGHTWTPSADGIPRSTLLLMLAFDPTDPDVLYAGTVQQGVFKSGDGGLTWAPLGTGLEGLNVRFLVVDPQHPGTLYAGTDEAGVLKIQQPGS